FLKRSQLESLLHDLSGAQVAPELGDFARCGWFQFTPFFRSLFAESFISPIGQRVIGNDRCGDGGRLLSRIQPRRTWQCDRAGTLGYRGQWRASTSSDCRFVPRLALVTGTIANLVEIVLGLELDAQKAVLAARIGIRRAGI